MLPLLNLYVIKVTIKGANNSSSSKRYKLPNAKGLKGSWSKTNNLLSFSLGKSQHIFAVLQPVSIQITLGEPYQYCTQSVILKEAKDTIVILMCLFAWIGTVVLFGIVLSGIMYYIQNNMTGISIFIHGLSSFLSWCFRRMYKSLHMETVTPMFAVYSCALLLRFLCMKVY